MTAPAPLGPSVINNHIAKRAPSRHDTIELIPADETGDLCDSDVLEKVRSKVANFIATEDETPDVISSIRRQSGLEQFVADKARRAKLMMRAGFCRNFWQETQRCRSEWLALMRQAD